jgi:hypothetical protein
MSTPISSEKRTIRWLRNTLIFVLIGAILGGYVWLSLKLVELNS